MKDAHGNTVHAVVNGWSIVSGEFCYVLTKSGHRPQVHRGSMEAAKELAARLAH